MAKKSSTVYIEENFWDMISKFQAERDLSSRNDAIQVILSEWNILKQIDFNNIQVNVTLGCLLYTSYTVLFLCCN